MDEHNSHFSYMRRALELARRAEGRTSPNPLVGAVIVNEGCIVGEGYHQRAGEPHAEIEALRQAGEAARGATMYVTLEPCAHYGRTPPCADALIAAGIAEVYYAIGDPNPKVNGRGHARLAAAGIRVSQGLCEAEAYQLNRPYFKHITTGQPFVTAKFAMSLDGKIATSAGQSRWISNPASRQRVHYLRNLTDVILVGAGTVIADDPLLTTRLSNADAAGDVRHPLRIVADSRGRVPLSARVFDPSLPGKTVVATTIHSPTGYHRELAARGVDVWVLPTDPASRVSLPDLMTEIGRRGLLTVFVESGSELLGALFKQRLVDRVMACIAPIIIGGRGAPGPIGGEGWAQLAHAARLRQCAVECIKTADSSETTTTGPDVWIQADVIYPEEG
ncbi:bifunctional diaminohydroxyphosphoribosylaminopyrimidine deaminase/5-amino-6-(5-phosphoribosylamino)uracil reductase RibD [Chloroflexus sp.]|uniref:bifunctional diaminohydroxyphosphoribosylaminopyrimidine deaminase/5-amino-6-(5-phosphoribosylamino)uracil reductase RibD n=1 Tax=Chloroflexus sp. TaxID=1904827 RepID=UPI00262098A1|nr:bifunctional diaminohydroxyphosphoribosylaminopyrimidine deaminase/5-amino-6-(5-phosphoribosylamino)uracil reductase RibD [uncultured Chloroflexus sp.]